MEHVATYLTELIGNTPLLELTHWQARHGLKARVLAKLEYMNPLGSVKDRVAAAMIDEGIRRGRSTKIRSSSNRRAAIQASAWPWSPP